MSVFRPVLPEAITPQPGMCRLSCSGGEATLPHAGLGAGLYARGSAFSSTQPVCLHLPVDLQGLCLRPHYSAFPTFQLICAEQMA